MRKRVFLRRAGGEVVSRWAALGMIFAVLTLVLSSFSIAPMASANPSETSTTSAPTRTAESSPSTTGQSSAPIAPTTTTKAPTTTTSQAPVTTTKAPAESTSPVTTTSVPTTTAQQRAAAVTPRGVNDKITVEITDVQVEGANGQQIKVGDSVSVKGKWDARTAAPQPGDQFTVRFPEVLKLDANPRIDLVGDGTVWGTCELVAATNLMTCVLTDAVADKPEDVYGDFEVYTQAVAYTTADDD